MAAKAKKGTCAPEPPAEGVLVRAANIDQSNYSGLPQILGDHYESPEEHLEHAKMVDLQNHHRPTTESSNAHALLLVRSPIYTITLREQAITDIVRQSDVLWREREVWSACFPDKDIVTLNIALIDRLVSAPGYRDTQLAHDLVNGMPLTGKNSYADTLKK